jgi:hypothetical protein
MDILIFVIKEKWEKGSILLFIPTYRHRLEKPVLTNVIVAVSLYMVE